MSDSSAEARLLMEHIDKRDKVKSSVELNLANLACCLWRANLKSNIYSTLQLAEVFVIRRQSCTQPLCNSLVGRR